MKLIRISGDRFDFEFYGEEKDLFLHVLNLYPLVPASHHRLTRQGRLKQQAENQQLLDDALKAQKLANKEAISALLNEPGRFAGGGQACRAHFGRAEVEWLLQVLNDVRIGSWIALGSPGYPQKKQPRLDKESPRHLMIMEIAGAFEMFFLGAVSGSLRPEADE